MPRLDDMMDRRAVTPSGHRGPKRSTRSKKTPPPQDRLSQRTLLWRRIKRSIRPGLWILGVGAVLVVGAELIRTLPSVSILHKTSSATTSAPIAPAASSTPAPAFVPDIHPGLLAEAMAGLGFRIDKIEINGASSITPGAVMAAMGIRDGDPTFGFSLKAMQQRLETLGAVQSVVIERLLPGTLVVNITERDVYAIWQTIQNGHPVFQIIDKEGNAIAGQDAALAKRREPSLLLLSGAGAPQQASTLIPELKALPTVFSHVAAAERVDDLRWNLILKNHTVVKLPPEHEQTALNELAGLQGSMQLLDRPVESIDLRQPGRLVVHPYVTAPTSKDEHKNDHRDARRDDRRDKHSHSHDDSRQERE